MRSSRTITLFSDRPDEACVGGFVPFFGSSCMAQLIGFVALVALVWTAKKPRGHLSAYTVRHLDLHAPEPQIARLGGQRRCLSGPAQEGADACPGRQQSEQPKPKCGELPRSAGRPNAGAAQD